MAAYEPNWENSRTLWTRDCLDVMRGMNTGSVDMIYMDPPFNSNANYAAPVGSPAEGAEFHDVWTLKEIDFHVFHELKKNRNRGVYDVIMSCMTQSDKAYMLYMAPRIIQCKRILSKEGSFWLHCDQTMVSHLKLLCDSIFGRDAYRDNIVWKYKNKKSGGARFQFSNNYDNILRYSRPRATFNRLRLAVYSDKMKAAIERGYFTENDKGKKKLFVVDENKTGARKALARKDDFDEVRNYVPKKPFATSVWEDIPALTSRNKERTGYRTQKPLKLLKRIILSTTNPEDMVFDPFCGNGTTLIAAERTGRFWAGVEIGKRGVEVLKDRLEQKTDLIIDGRMSLEGVCDEPDFGNELPQRNDIPGTEEPSAKEKTRLRKKMWLEQDKKCGFCGDELPLKWAEIDHKVSKKRGGTWILSNLWVLCAHCNRRKGKKILEVFQQELGEDKKGMETERTLGI